ncbi:MAG TPA: cupin domain-containing protein [Rhizomicrobium sp.]|jgi:quercetin dioxygenase-like cupin family protein
MLSGKLYGLTLATLAASALSLTSANAWAGDCPPDKIGTNVTKPGPMAPSGVTDTVIGSIDLGPLGSGFQGRAMRMRKLVVQPGGVVPWHSHAARPANIYVVSGSITEYRSSCSVPIEHASGDVTSEFGPFSHWWRNNGQEPAVLISADMLPPAMKPDESM